MFIYILVYPGECSMFEMNVYFIAFGWTVLYMSLRVIWSVVFRSLVSLLIYCLDTLFIVAFSLQFCQHLFHIFMCINVGCLYIYNCYILLLNWQFYYNIMSVFISCGIFDLRSNLSDMSMVIFIPFWLPFAFNICFLFFFNF